MKKEEEDKQEDANNNSVQQQQQQQQEDVENDNNAQLEEEERDDDDLLLQQQLQERIAKVALEHYNIQFKTQKGKPQPEKEWTIYAAIVAVCCRGRQQKIWVVSCATGSKCTSLDNNNNYNNNIGWILHDGHAEILARRGFQRVLWHSLLHPNNNDNNHDDIPYLLLSKNNNEKDDNPTTTTTTTWKWNPDITLHLYISDSPCGDASIFPLDNHHPDENHTTTNNTNTKKKNTTIHFTGAKLILPTTTVEKEKKTIVLFQDNNQQQQQQQHCFCLGRELEDQVVGKLRVKSGRSNIDPQNRSTSMSCSDKLCRYQLLGYQGTILRHLIPQPIGMTSIIVSAHPKCHHPQHHQQEALHRAIPQRIQQTLTLLFSSNNSNMKRCVVPKVYVVSSTFSQGKSIMEYQHHQQRQQQTRKDRHHYTQQNTKRQKLNQRILSPCGIAFNWQCTSSSSSSANDLEIIVGAKGTRQGRKKGTWNQLEQSIPSRLSRWELWKLARQYYANNNHHNTTTTTNNNNNNNQQSYQEYKQQLRSPSDTKLHDLIFQSKNSPFHGWIRNSQKGDFKLTMQETYF